MYSRGRIDREVVLVGLLDIFKKKKEDKPVEAVDANGQVQVVPEGMQDTTPVVDNTVPTDMNAVPSTDFGSGEMQPATPLMDQAAPVDGPIVTEIPTEPTTIPVDTTNIDAPMPDLPSGFGNMEQPTTDVGPIDNPIPIEENQMPEAGNDFANQDIQPVDVTASMEETGATIDNPIPAQSEVENMAADLNAVVGEDITPQEDINPIGDIIPQEDIQPMGDINPVEDIPGQGIQPIEGITPQEDIPSQDIDGSTNFEWGENPFKEEGTDITPPVEEGTPFTDMPSAEKTTEVPTDVQDITPTEEVVNLDSNDEVINLESTPSEEAPEENFEPNPFQEEVQEEPQVVEEEQEETPVPVEDVEEVQEVVSEETPNLEEALPEEDSVPDVQIPEIPSKDIEEENKEDEELANELDKTLTDIDVSKPKEETEPVEEVEEEKTESEEEEEPKVEPVLVEEEESDIFALPRIGDDVYPDIFQKPSVISDEEEEETSEEEVELTGPVLKEESAFTIFDLPSLEDKKKKKKKKKTKKEEATEEPVTEPIVEEAQEEVTSEEPIEDIEEVKGIEVNLDEEENNEDDVIIPLAEEKDSHDIEIEDTEEVEEEKIDISDIFKKMDFKNEKIRFCENCGAMILGNSETICPSCGEPL